MRHLKNRHITPFVHVCIFATLCMLTTLARAVPHVCAARAYGAKADGHTLNTAAIQKAIDACASEGGGVVRLSGGVFLSGPIHLKSNIDLQIAKGATLRGTSDHSAYPRKTEFRKPGLWSLVSATEADHVSITGGGVIDGAGQSWWKIVRADHDHGIMGEGVLRPRLVVFDHCKNVLIKDVTIENSPFWQVVPYYSTNVTIENVRVLAPAHSPNTDAVDPFSSSHVFIRHLYADVGDDNIAIKSGAIDSPGGDSPSRDIVIEDCTFLHGHGLSIGSEIAGGAQNITATNITFRGTDHGIRIKSGRDRGNDVGNLVFRDLKMIGVKIPIVINEYYPRSHPPHADTPQPVTRLTPHFHDIVIEDLQATGAERAGIIAGLPESPVKNLILRNVSIHARQGLEIANAQIFTHQLSIHAATGEPIQRFSNVIITPLESR